MRQVIVGFIFILINQVFANIFYSGQNYTFEQPDGSLVEAKLFGDVAAMYAETPDGYTLIRGVDGWLYYAESTLSGSKLSPSSHIYRGLSTTGLKIKPHIRRSSLVDQQAIRKFHLKNSNYLLKPSYKSLTKKSSQQKPDDINHYRSFSGTIRGIVLLVDFSDEPATHTVQDISDFLNQKGYSKYGNNGSVRDFYRDASNGKLDFIHDLSPTYFRAPNPKSYYDNGPYSVTKDLLKDAIEFFDDKIDFSLYDNDKDGTIEDLSIIYAGKGQIFGKGIWPHSGGFNAEKDGVKISRYQITDADPGFLGLYVMAHESGHLIFGWPDAYGTGDQGIMGSRSSETNPPLPSDVYRADQGWIHIVDVDENTHAYFSDVMNDSIVYRWKNKNKRGEWFLWSNRSNKGRYKVLKGSGLQIYHFDYGVRTNSPPKVLSLAVVQADGKDYLGQTNWPAPGSDPNDFFHSKTLDHFDSNSTPATNWNDSTYSGLNLHSIGLVGDTMSFAVGSNPVSLFDKNSFLQASDLLFRASFQGKSLMLTSHQSQQVQVLLRNVLGQEVYSSSNTLLQPGANYLSIGQLPRGLYVVDVKAVGYQLMHQVLFSP